MEREGGIMYPVETIRRQTVHKNEPADIVLPDSAREEDTVTFVSDLSYVTFGNDPLSYRIDTLDPRKLKEEGLPVEDRAAALERLELRDARQFDDVFHYNVSVTRGGKGRQPNITFNVKTVELPPFVDVQRFYVQLQGKKEVAVRHLTTVPEDHEAVTIIEVLEYETGGDDNYQYATRAFGCGREIVVVAFSDNGNKNSRVVLRATVLSWPVDSFVEIPAVPQTFTVRGRGVKGGAEKVVDFSLDEPRRFVVTPTMYITKGRRFQYEKFQDKKAILENINLGGVPFEEAEDAISLTGFIGQVSGAVAGFFSRNIEQIATNLGGAVTSVIKALGSGGEQDFGLEIESLTTSERTTVKMELSPESEAGKNAFGEFTVIPLKFPPRVLFTPHLIHRLPPAVIQDVIRFGADDG